MEDLLIQLISFSTALLAEGKGFHIKEGGRYSYPSEDTTNKEEFTTVYMAPQSLLQRWLREQYKLVVLVEIGKWENEYICRIIDYRTPFTSPIFTKINDKYEVSLEEGLVQALKMIK